MAAPKILRDNPSLASGGATGVIVALLVYYGVLDVEAAGLWAVLLGFILPPLSGWVSRFFTVPLAKVEDAGRHNPAISVEAIDHAAKRTRRDQHAARKGSV